jgi:DNA-binding transcriptional LysR family regulator
LAAIARLLLPVRLNRVEPRAVKRRPKPHRLLTQPRHIVRARLESRHRGIVLQPTSLVGPDLLAGTLVEVMPAYRCVELGVYAVYPSRKLVSPKVRLMIEFLVNAFRMRAWPA